MVVQGTFFNITGIGNASASSKYDKLFKARNKANVPESMVSKQSICSHF